MPEPGGLETLLAGFAEELALLLLAGDQVDSERVARDALGAGLPATLIDDHVVRPAMRSIGERHVVGLLMAADLLEDAGYAVLVAGADVPADSLAALIERHRPQLLGLTATMSQTASSLRASVATAHEAALPEC